MPNLKKNIFNRKYLNYLLSRVEKSSIPDIKDRQDVINDWINYIQSGNIDLTKETALQGNFLDDIFSKALGYKSRIKNTEQWNLNQEQLTTIDSKFADGSLGFFSKEKEDVRVVIELKGSNINLDEKQHRHNDTRTPIEQAFSYQHKIGSKCKWIIVSNYKEIRLYHHSTSTEYEVFNITELGNWEQFRRFYFLLSVDNLISSIGDSVIDTLYAKNEVEEVNISKQFYLDFKQIRTKLFEHLKQNNPAQTELLLLEKTQKFLDRFIFLCFCEDNRLLPEKTFKKIIETGKRSFTLSESKIWNELKGLFQAINVGSPTHNINKFNGGLFATDMELDGISIKDNILEEVAKLTEYDFETDIDVNILGHIFEQSISDIEEIKAGIEGKGFDKKTSKRKKDGIYYTPEYITKYIVENAVGGWLEDRKKELGYYELPELSDCPIGHKPSAKNKHLEFWQAYKMKLMEIKVLDPACGSGAFLNQAFNFLYAEGQNVNDRISELSGGQTELFGLDKHILSNNLFGVDLNNESVEITKLSLWIKTANAHAELTALDNNIKCGNSLIDDPKVAGDKAFNWFTEFPSVFPGYRDYSKKYYAQEYQHLTIEEIRERNLREPEVEYKINQEKLNQGNLHDPSYSYKPDSKGFQKHGFDVIIGNPPWGACFDISESNYLIKKHPLVPTKIKDSYLYFTLASLNLINYNGILGIIIPNTWLLINNAKDFREYLLKNNLIKIVDYGDNVFEDAIVESTTIILKKGESDLLDCEVVRFRRNNLIFKKNINKQFWLDDEFKRIVLDIDNSSYHLIRNIENKCEPFNKNNEIIFGIKPYQIGYGIPPQNKEDVEKRIYHNHLKLDDTWHPLITGTDITRYNLEFNNDAFIKYGMWLMYPSNEEKIKSSKLLLRRTSSDLKATIDEEGFYPQNSLFIITSTKYNLKYLMLLFNSCLFNFIYKKKCPQEGKIFAEVKPSIIKSLPIVSATPEAQEPFIALADIMLEKNKGLQNIKNEFLTFIKTKFGIEKATSKLKNWYELEYNEFLKELTKAKVNLPLEEQLSWQALFAKQKALAMELKAVIDGTDKKIDQLVYELYGLTEEEIRIVEGG